MFFFRHAYVRHLEAEIVFLRTEMRRHEQRAADAVDQLVRLKTEGQAALPPRPLIADREKDVSAELQRVFADSEFSEVGT